MVEAGEPDHGKEIYPPHAQAPYFILDVVVKGAGDPLVLVPAIRTVLKNLDP